jgi:hypothetical protein
VKRSTASRAAFGLLALLTAVSSVAGAYHQHLTLEARAGLSIDAKASDSASAGPCLVCRAAREQAPAVEAPDRPAPLLAISPLVPRPVVLGTEAPLPSTASPRAPPAASEAVSL